MCCPPCSACMVGLSDVLPQRQAGTGGLLRLHHGADGPARTLDLDRTEPLMEMQHDPELVGKAPPISVNMEIALVNQNEIAFEILGPIRGLDIRDIPPDLLQACNCIQPWRRQRQVPPHDHALVALCLARNLEPPHSLGVVGLRCGRHKLKRERTTLSTLC
jgi:hypothetical protein